MKKFYLIFLLIIFASSSKSQWLPDIWFVNTYGYNSLDKSVASSNNLVHVVWHDYRNSTWEIYYKRSSDGGLTWGNDTRLTYNAGQSDNPTIYANGLDVYVVWHDNSDGNFEIYFKHSTDGGINWGPDTRITYDNSISFHPTIYVSGSTIHVVWQESRDGNLEIYYIRSINDGANWESENRLTNNIAQSEFPSISVSGSNVNVVWNDNRDGNNEIYYKRSINNGMSWGSDYRITNDPGVSQDPSISVSESNEYIVWEDNRFGNSQVFYKNSSDGGLNWSSEIGFSSISSTSLRPSIISSGTKIHVAWYEANSHSIFYKYSPNSGLTWNPNTNLTTTASGNCLCTGPSITAAGDAVHIVWTDAARIFYKGSSIQNTSYTILTSPNGGENYFSGTVHNINWTSSVSNIKIELTTNNGNSWSLITWNYPADSGRYSWTVPDLPSSQCKIKISDSDNLGTNDISDSNFTITHSTPASALDFDGINDYVKLPDSLTIRACGGNTAITIEYWFKGSSNQSAVRFQNGNGFIVSGWFGLHIISTDGNTSNGLPIGTASIDGNWHHVAMTWNKNKINGFNSYLDGNIIASRNSADANLPNLTDGGFIGGVYGNPEFTNGSLDEVRIWNRALNQSEILQSMNCEIPFSNYGLLANYHFNQGINNADNSNITSLTDYSGNSYHGILNNFALNSSSSNWIAPGGIVNGISCIENLSLYEPNGSENWFVGFTKQILWYSPNYVSNVKLEYSINNGTTWNLITSTHPAANYSYSWTIPNNAISSQCKIKISDVNNSNLFDISDNSFIISQAPSNLIVNGEFSQGNTDFATQYLFCNSIDCICCPNQYAVGTDASYFHSGDASGHDHTTGTGNFMILDGSQSLQYAWKQISNVSQNKTYEFSSWFTQLSSENPSNLQVKINGINIGQPFQLPNIRNSWYKHSVIWNSGQSSSADIEIYNLNLTGSGNDFGIDDIRLSVYDTTLSLNTGLISYYPFNGNTNDASGNGYHGTNHGATLTSDNIGNLNKAYYFNGADNYISIPNLVINNPENITLYALIFPERFNFQSILYYGEGGEMQIVTEDNKIGVRIKLSDFNWYIASDIDSIDQSWYSIAGVWQKGNSLKLYVNGVLKKTISLPNLGILSAYGYHASIGDRYPHITNPFKGKIDEVRTYSRALSQSEIQQLYNPGSPLTITSPNGGESISSGSIHNITFTNNSISNIKIEYSTNNGGIWNLINANYPTITGSYGWTVPNVISTQCKIKISDINSSATDVSDYTFNIVNSNSTLSGKIKNNSSNNPVIGAIVILTSQYNSTYQSTTNDSGNYIINSIPSGNYNIKITKPGYKLSSENIVILNGSNVKNYSLIPDNVNVLTLTENKLNIYADNISEISNNNYVLNGNVNINNILYFNGEVSVDKSIGLTNPVVKGYGTLSAKHILGESYNLCSGNFFYKAIDTTLVPKDKTFLLPTSLFNNFTLNSGILSITPDGKILKQDFIFLNLPYPFGLIFDEIGKDVPLYPKELAGGVFYSKDRGKDFSVNIAVNNVIDLGYFAVTNFEFGYESINDKISGKIKLRFGRVSSFVGSPNLVYIGSQKTEEVLVEIPDVKGNKENIISLDKFASNINSSLGKSSYVEIGFDFQFINGTIDRFVISADNLKIPIFSPYFYLDGITGGFENFSSGHFTVIAQANISTKLDDISPIGSPIKTENAGFKIAPFDFFELSSGTVKIFGWPVGNASITYDNNLKVFKPKGYLDLYQILTGNFEFSLGESLNGTFAADFKTPDNLPFAFKYLENKRFAGISGHLNNKTIDFKIGQRILGKNVFLSVYLTYGKPIIPWFYTDFAVNVKNLKKSWKGYDKGRQIITFSVPVNSPQLYVVSGSTTNSFNYTLISPSGKVYDSTYSSYGKFDSLKQTIVIIDKPQQGEWSYFTNQPGEIILETYSIDQEPTVLIENPSSKNSMSNNVSLKFNDYSDNLDVDVYYDTDNKNYDGVLIKHFNILNNATLDFLWNNEDVPNGEYYIYSIISDGKNPVAQQYAPGSIYVQNNNFIITPQNVTALQAGDSIQVKWDLNEDNRIYGTKVNFKNLSNGKTGQMLTTDTNFVFLKNLKPGQKYEIYLNYFDTSGAYGNVSSKLQTFFKKNIGNNPPCFINNDSDLIFVENEENFYSLSAEDADNNPLTFTISGSNLGIFMSGNKLSWIPSSGQTGIYEIKFVVSDGKSSDTLVKQAIVYTKEQTIPKVDFSSVNLFENDNLFLKLKNFRSVKSFENVLLRNKRTSEQHLIECRRVDASNFIGNFNLSYLNASSLGVMNKDTVLALYNYGSFYDTAFAIYDSAFQETDNTPPASITDLNAYSDGINRIKLQWTATGDDGNTGEALKYDIRYSYSPILTENSYLTAFRFESGQYPSAPGVKDSVSINIHDLTDYLNNDSVYFSIKAEDAYQNKSILGNCSGYRYIYSATNLNTTISDIYKININWTGVENSLLKMNGEKIEGAMFKYYRLYRKIDTSAFELIADSIAQLNYIDNLFYYPDADYKYSLQAIYNIGGSDTVYSNSISLNRFTNIRLLCTTNDSNYSNDSISILMRGLDTIYSQSFFGMSRLTGLVMFNNVFGSYYKININKPGFPEIIDTIYISDSTDNYSYSYSTSINVKLIPSGFYNTTLNKLNINDTVRAYLRNISLPYNIVDSSTDILDSISMYANFKFSNAVNGNYYIVIKHRNSIETWSKSGGEVFTKYTTMNFDLTSSQSQAFGNNLIQIGSAWCLYSGDVNQDEVIDASDLSEVDNDAYNSVSGYVRTDLTGDDFVDAADVSIVDNNAYNSVSVIRP